MRTLMLAVLLSFPAASGAEPTTKIIWHGHAAFEIVTPRGHVLLVDPWLNNPANPAAKGKDPVAALKRVDYVLVTHGHSDHIGDAVAIAKKTKAKLVANVELGQNMARLLGYPAELARHDTLINSGGEIELSGGEARVQMTPAVHSSGIDPSAGADPKAPIAYGGNANGFLIKIKDGPVIYHTGDTAFFKDMEQLAAADVDLALLNIGGHFGMEPDAAALAARAVNPKLVIPHHYKTFPLLTQDPTPFFKELDEDKIAHRELEPGGSIEFAGREPRP